MPRCFLMMLRRNAKLEILGSCTRCDHATLTEFKSRLLICMVQCFISNLICLNGGQRFSLHNFDIYKKKESKILPFFFHVTSL